MEAYERSPPCMPVIPRLDRLDSLMKYLEGKHNLSKWSDDSIWMIDKQCRPLDLAVEEVHAKGSVLDRILLLENRMLQLSLDMEASSTSSSSTVETYESTSKRNGFEIKQGLLPLRSFNGRDLREQKHFHENNPHEPGLQVNHPHEPGLQENCNEEKVKRSISELKCLLGESGDEDTGKKSEKKKRTRRWRHKRLLGC
ncbi:uncharacterized protein LOC143886861 [Tasmannia lanceolata]|uniref:uncharacterized protein LOC143886861 n=1 Tax=Tasmannia lanceolata TaxID=3420 RepID=UPI0040627E6D